MLLYLFIYFSNSTVLFCTVNYCFFMFFSYMYLILLCFSGYPRCSCHPIPRIIGALLYSDFCRFWLLCTEDDSPSGIETAVCAFFAHICALFTLAFHIWISNIFANFISWNNTQTLQHISKMPYTTQTAQDILRTSYYRSNHESYAHIISNHRSYHRFRTFRTHYRWSCDAK